LLHDMREFMRDQAPSVLRGRREPAAAEHDIVPDRVCIRVGVSRRFVCCCTGMDTDVGKIVLEAAFHVSSQRRLKRTAGPIEDVGLDSTTALLHSTRERATWLLPRDKSGDLICFAFQAP